MQTTVRSECRNTAIEATTIADALSAERVKLLVPRATRVRALLVVAVSLTFAALTFRTAASVTPEQVVFGMKRFGVVLLMIVSAKLATDEYHHSAVRTTLSGRILAAKAAVTATFAAALTAVLVVASYFVARSVGGTHAAARLSLLSTTTWRPLWTLPLYASLAAVLALALGALFRQARPVIGALILWPGVVEWALGDFAPRTQAWLPFTNASLFVNGYAEGRADAMAWGPAGGLMYFAGFVAVVFGAATLVAKRCQA